MAKTSTVRPLKDGDHCMVVGGTHAGKSGIVRDIHASASGNITITVVQANGVRFKTLGKNVVVEHKKKRSAKRGVSPKEFRWIRRTM